ncbi:lytic transglycosylase domain-containing protein [Mesorhizobium sp. STM 4661]|uniref:lytic transglycosylase domain-containing protein n=1 Tax=Mesorhizobium sp. STM 4661 TaxID=1297570 RepID=UPI0002BE3ABF|nr:lytic transglycosylase domain-containing protein [Mesorhizobium sp. STM 4661]CCV15722.1 Lytic transglycosylase catalytic [Mesorhizobium sp. STM 4661]
MPAKLNLIAIGAVLAAAGLVGCTSTSQVKPAPSFTEPAAAAGADAGFALALPDTVSVLPEPSGNTPSGNTPVQAAAVSADPAAPPVEPAAAFAGPTPGAAAVPAVMTSKAGPAAIPVNAPAYTTAGLVVPATAEKAGISGVQQVAYVVPRNPTVMAPVGSPEAPASGPRAEIERLIEKYAAFYQVPVDLVRQVVNRESTFNPKAYNRGHWGLMQIKHATARGMGYDGPARGLFDAETNLKYAVKYLRGAWLVSDGNAKRADRLYQTGYYYDAKRKGMLEETGLGRDRNRRRLQPDA